MNCLVTDYLESTAKQFPDKVAYIDQERTITFQELRSEAHRLAWKFIEAGIFKKPVLLFMEKSISLVCAFMGAAYSGNFYSPVDTKMPQDRIHKIITTFEPAVIITDRKHKSAVETMVSGVDIWVFEDIVEGTTAKEEQVLYCTGKVIDTDILYVLFTSGSTGTPKGVIINHKAAVDFVDWISDCYGFDETTVFANQAQLYFDLSIQDVYTPMKKGSTTVLIPNRLYAAPVRVWKLILKHQVNTLVWIPSMLSLFANLDILSHVEKAPLRTVLFCGEVMPMKQLNYWRREYPQVVYGNLYGPTECAEACTYYTIDRDFRDDEVLPIGKPCENSDALVMNEDGNIVTEIGQIGELCIRGTCLSCGYYGDPERTAEVFVQNPANNKYPELVYKTGDLVCYNDRMELVYVCRKDFQIKIRGYRVELGEIEAAASSIEGIQYNCCLFDKESEKIILVYAGNVSESQVVDILKTKVQDYMVPAEYHKRDTMIFNINGKVDRKALEKEYIIR